MEKIFMVRQKLHPSFGWNAGRSFVKISKEQLEFLGGDRSYFDLLQIKNKTLHVSKNAKLNYDINEINKGQLEIFLATYERNHLAELRSEKPRSYRRCS